MFFEKKIHKRQKNMCGTFKKVTKKQEKPSIFLFITIKNIYKQKHFLDNNINIS